MLATIIYEFELEAKQQVLFQALLQGEDGLALVRCVHGVQQLWTTAAQEAELLQWLQALPEQLKPCILRQYVWQGVWQDEEKAA